MKIIAILAGCFVFCMQIAHAQLCQGNFGDPIINADFGSGANPGPPLSSGITSYNFVNNDCPVDGEYAIRSNTQNCFGSTWHSLTSDHTGNTNGYMMVINASYERGVFYTETVRNLCAGTTFQFSAYLLNLLRNSTCTNTAILPDITFLIEKADGTVIGSVDTGPVTSSSVPSWKQYGFVFTLPAGINDVVLKIKNNADGGCGNDIALDDIQFRPCGPSVFAGINGFTADTISHCSGQPARYVFSGTTTNFYSNPGYQWQQFSNGSWADIPGANSLQYTVNFPAQALPGKYLYRLSTAETENMASVKCRVSSQQLMINILEGPSVNAGPDKTIIAGDLVQLNGSASGDSIVHRWLNSSNISDVNLLQPLVNPPADETYILQVQSRAGCGTVEDAVFVKVFPDIYFPNTFTPDADGKNDRWIIKALEAFPAYELKIYNRYGQLIFSDSGSRIPWNGKYKGQDAEPGVYVYFFKPANSKRFKKGTLLLLR
ncbi:MAG: gliding motility-associated C-terminal domain-containing protein [Ferruginibacter sp.]